MEPNGPFAKWDMRIFKDCADRYGKRLPTVIAFEKTRASGFTTKPRDPVKGPGRAKYALRPQFTVYYSPFTIYNFEGGAPIQ